VRDPWKACLKESGVDQRFTIHGLRRTVNDLTRRASVDVVVVKSLTGHVTEKMREHYSTVRIDEKHQAVAKVHNLVPLRTGRPGKAGSE
jgi:integrase